MPFVFQGQTSKKNYKKATFFCSLRRSVNNGKLVECIIKKITLIIPGLLDIRKHFQVK